MSHTGGLDGAHLDLDVMSGLHRRLGMRSGNAKCLFKLLCGWFDFADIVLLKYLYLATCTSEEMRSSKAKRTPILGASADDR